MCRPSVNTPCYLLSVVSFLQHPSPICGKRQPHSRMKLLPSWRELMSYRGDGLGPEQRRTHSPAGSHPSLGKGKAATSSETSRARRIDARQPDTPECQRRAIWAVTHPLPPQPIPSPPASRTVIASHPAIPSWVLAHGKSRSGPRPSLSLTGHLPSHTQAPWETQEGAHEALGPRADGCVGRCYGV